MKKRTIIDIILIFVLLGVLIVLGQIDYKQDEKKDSRRFDKDYSMVSKDNVFKYVNDEELYKIINKGNAVVFFGFKENEWCNYYAKILNDSAKSVGLDKIYYYDFFFFWEKSSTYYRKIVDYMKDYLKITDTNKFDIYSPSLIVIKDKNVIYYDDETSIVYSFQKPKDYWNEDSIKVKSVQFESAFNTYLGKDIGGTNGGEE